MFPLTLWTLSLVTLRLQWSGSPRYQWLYWDLFLALVPLGLALIAEHTRRARPIVLVAWLLFFPNAPYLLTELIHFRIADGAPHWLDIAMLVSAACTGIAAGAASLDRVLTLLTCNARVRLALELVACALCGFGIYVGRYDRWNSWDVVTRPIALAQDLIAYVAHPAAHAQVWLISFVFAGSVFFAQRVASSRQ